MSLIPQPINKEGPSFEQWLLNTLVEEKCSSDYTTSLGVTPMMIIEYTRGECSIEDRNYVQRVLLKSRWALNSVVGLTKAARDKQSRAAQLLSNTNISSLTDSELLEMINSACHHIS